MKCSSPHYIKNVVIELKYLEKEHTQMKADSMHAMIETTFKKGKINVLCGYVTVYKRQKKH